jgi:Right handed beta helix region
MWNRNWTGVGMIAIAVACREPNTAPAALRAPAFALAGAAACPTPANFIVSNEAELRAALAAATPGQVIGVRGNIALSKDVLITTPGITLTCASAAAGLTAEPSDTDMLTVLADRVTVDGLVLDGTNAVDGPYAATGAAGVQLTNNTVTCGIGICAFFASATPKAVVADNHFVSNSDSSFGLHLQLGIDSSRVERNTMVTTVPIFIGIGGIRARDGRGVVIANNVVLGPWLASIALADLAGSVVERNRLEGAEFYGVRGRVGGSLIGPISVTDNLFRANVITGAGAAGMLLRNACHNMFVGNDLQGNAGNIGLIFTSTTGANTLVGNQTVVVDNGAFDCNGDGVNDPNVITGVGAVLHEANLGQIVSDAVVSSNRLR